jgi:hypothetical protein
MIKVNHKVKCEMTALSNKLGAALVSRKLCEVAVRVVGTPEIVRTETVPLFTKDSLWLLFHTLLKEAISGGADS